MDKDTYKKALEMLRSVKEGQKLSREQMEKERRDLVLGVSKDIAQTLAPSLEALANQSRLTRRDLLDAISEININVNAPEVNIPTINVPQPKVSVFPPEIKIPEIKMPDEMNIKGWVSLMGVDLNNPLPVQLRDGNGNPVTLFENLNQFISGGGGGFRRVRIDNPSTEPVNVQVVSGAGATSATNIVDSTGVAYTGSNPIPVLSRPVNVRGRLATAYVTEDEIQEITLLAGVAGEYHDLISVMCANESTVAINLDFRQTTGGTVQMSVEVPANGTAGISLPVPIPQDHADATWTVKNSASDNSNTVYSVTALFSKEV